MAWYVKFLCEEKKEEGKEEWMKKKGGTLGFFANIHKLLLCLQQLVLHPNCSFVEDPV